MAAGPRSVASSKASVTDNGYVYQVRRLASHPDTGIKNLAVGVILPLPSQDLWKGSCSDSKHFYEDAVYYKCLRVLCCSTCHHLRTVA